MVGGSQGSPFNLESHARRWTRRAPPPTTPFRSWIACAPSGAARIHCTTPFRSKIACAPSGALAPHPFDLGSHARPRTQRASLTQHHPDLASRVCHHLRLSAREGTLLTLDSHGPLFGAILGHRSATRKGTLRSYDFSARKGLATLLRDLVSIPRL